jgi:hypothetical protein
VKRATPSILFRPSYVAFKFYLYRYNMAVGMDAVVVGGIYNKASGDGGVVAGGEYNVAASLHATVVGGVLNAATHDHGTVAGGMANTASHNFSVVGLYKLNPVVTHSLKAPGFNP